MLPEAQSGEMSKKLSGVVIDVLTAHSYFNQQFSQSHGWKSPVNLLANGDGLFDNGGIFRVGNLEKYFGL